MLIPYKVDVPMYRRPVLNWILVGVISLVFCVQFSYHVRSRGIRAVPTEREVHQRIFEKLIHMPQEQRDHITEEQLQTLAEETIAELIRGRSTEPQFLRDMVLDGWTASGLLGHMFLHGSWWHLIGNMIFLWVFGNAICAKIGNVAYPLVFMALGLSAAVAHILFSGGPALGASGAINGIVGMFLVLYPLNNVSLMYWFGWLWYGSSSVSSYWIILLWCVFDVLGIALGAGGVAYYAHIGGFVAGFTLAFLLIVFKALKTGAGQKTLPEIWGMAGSVRRTTRPSEAAGQFIHFRCTCGRTVRAPREYAGRRARCPTCGATLTVPGG